MLSHRLEGGRVRLNWGSLELAAATRVAKQEDHDAAFEARIGGQAPKIVRLSEEKLA